ncbi:hypothetical protein JS756_24085 [Streptomyces actuosus]|uniref:Uncharacterized protein n=1 Tax=Streptomyces actuosus TaxID=1885 RepID=A0ABS2VVQ0_STRAS|nr:hypothetical protein [Streptomyces actuosus]MBN0047129.1 hypothetical protein [Streptomyces actuosus]
MIGRYVNAACYAITGMVILFLEASRGWDAKLTLAALATLAYGGYVGLTRGSYWVSSYTYVIPVLVICYAVSNFAD